MESVSRLIRTFAPEHYTLSVTLHRTERQLEGVVDIKGALMQDASELRLHAHKLTVLSASIDGKAAEFSYADNDELVITQDGLSAGSHIVTVTYSADITDDMNGTYPCYYEVEGEKKELIATQFESHYARRAFPCVDEPEAKATFDLILSTEQDVVALSNMPVKTQSTQDDRLVTVFDTTPRMSTYLLAWVVGDLQKKTATSKNGVEVSIWSTKAHGTSNLDFPLDIAVRTIDFFDEYFNVPYPLPKSDHVALPDFSSGAMENWGLITYREIALLVDPENTTLSTKQYAATVIAHELSHQWFGNLVTMKWWNDLWLNESFANMMEYVAIDAIEPSWNVWLDFASAEVISALRRDSLDGVQSIQIDVNHPDEISTIFDPSIVYAKGGRLLRMLQSYVGDKAMQKGLQSYFETFRYKNTSASDLWTHLSEASGKDVNGFMHAWMTQPGFPVVSAAKNGDTITLSQDQFFIGPHESKERTWPIPLHGSSAEVPALLDTQSTSFVYSSDTPFKLNSESTAHFITKYDEALLDALVRDIPNLSAVDKLSLLHEQLLLAKAGLQSYAAVLPLLAHFRNETNESVWSIIAVALNELKRFVEDDKTSEATLKQYAVSVAQQQYERLGWTIVEGEDENDTKLRSLIIGLMLYGEDADALRIAREQFDATSYDKLDPELRSAILANAVRYEFTPTIVDDLIAAYQKETNSELRDDIAGALTSTRNDEVIAKLLELLADKQVIRHQDFTHWFVWMLRNRFSREATWAWARNHWDWIEKIFKADSSYDMFPRYIAGALVSKQQQAEYTDFFSPLENEIALARNIKIGYVELEATVSLLSNDGPKVRQALLELDLN